jgi:hypothetical protein
MLVYCRQGKIFYKATLVYAGKVSLRYINLGLSNLAWARHAEQRFARKV